ncbi:MAG: cbb3-type cytochrome c oxidase subunit 3 [Gammaproteobacteria bacterium]|nr:cbb3-type cytochrome c oxidase subunit 3 [Gammaproteobacteria bacterium]
MDMNDLRALSTVLMFLTFLGIIAWTVIGGRDRFRDAANLPFADDESPDTDKTRQEKSS